MRSLEARMKRVEDCLEKRLAPNKNRPFLLSDLSEEEAADLVRWHKSACQVFFTEFGGKPPIEPAHALPMEEELQYWVQKWIDSFIVLISALERGGVDNERIIERARALPELKPWVEWAERRFHKRAQA